MAAFTVSTRFSSPLNLNAADFLVVTREGAVSVAFTGTSAITGAGSNVLTLNGFVSNTNTGAYGVLLNGGGNNITLGDTGYVFGNVDGFHINGAGGNTITSSGEIFASTGSGMEIAGAANALTLLATSDIIGQTFGVHVGAGSNSLANTGSILGRQDGVMFLLGGNTIFNGGDIHGLDHGLRIAGAANTGLNTIVNTGLIRGDVAEGIRSNQAINMTNSGTIDCDRDGILLNTGAGSSTLTNTGYIYGRSGQALDFDVGHDTVVNNGFMMGTDALSLNAGNDFFDGRNGLQFGGVDGSTGNDILFGGAGADDLRGGADNDQLMGGANLDNLDGGAGFDYARYDLGGAVTVSLANPGANTGDAAGDSFTLIEGIIGSQFGDVILGDGNANTLMGLGGADGIAGGAGADTILGGDGADVLFGEADGDFITGGVGGDVIRGGLGADTFIYNVGDGGDLIQQLNEGGVQDHFDLRSFFDTIGYAGTDPRGAGLMQVLQNGADTDVYLQGSFMFRIEGVVAAAIDDTYFLFQ